MKMCFNIHTAQLLAEVFLIYGFPSPLAFHFENILFIIVVVSCVTLSRTEKKTSQGVHTRHKVHDPLP